MKRTVPLLLAAALLAAAPLGAAEAPPAPAQQGGIPAGYRGTPLPVSGSQLLYLKKGDRLDVMVTFEAVINEGKKEIKEVVTATILQNVVVVNLRRPDRPEGQGVVELLLNPEEAQYAALSVAKARTITLAVRAPGDTELHQMQMASLRRLIR